MRHCIGKTFGGALTIFSALIATSNAVHLHLSSNYMVNIESNSTTIEFKIEATGVTGWVGIGINDIQGGMVGADMYIGGVKNGKIYGDDYNCRDKCKDRPTKDPVQNWKLISAAEENGKTTLHVSRPLISPDKLYDLDIQNETMFFLWSYQANNDSREAEHTKSGSCSIKLLSGTQGNCHSGSESNVTKRSGISALLMGLIAIVLKL